MIPTPEQRQAHLAEQMTCPLCDGEGHDIDFLKCDLCYGDKRITGERVMWLWRDFQSLRDKAKRFIKDAGLS